MGFGVGLVFYEFSVVRRGCSCGRRGVARGILRWGCEFWWFRDGFYVENRVGVVVFVLFVLWGDRGD